MSSETVKWAFRGRVPVARLSTVEVPADPENGMQHHDGPLDNSDGRTRRPQTGKERPSDLFTGLLPSQIVVLQFT